jgi:hypothetical protein
MISYFSVLYLDKRVVGWRIMPVMAVMPWALSSIRYAAATPDAGAVQPHYHRGGCSRCAECNIASRFSWPRPWLDLGPKEYRERNRGNLIAAYHPYLLTVCIISPVDFGEMLGDGGSGGLRVVERFQ